MTWAADVISACSFGLQISRCMLVHNKHFRRELQLQFSSVLWLTHPVSRDVYNEEALRRSSSVLVWSFDVDKSPWMCSRAAEGSLCTDGQHIARRSSVTDFSGRVSRRLFTVDSRPQSLHLLYRTCVTSPVDVIAQCDVYRTDGKIGAAIFSVPIACLNDRPTEDYLTVPVAAVR